MQVGPGIDPHKLIDRLYKVKKLSFNTYEVDHTEIKGTVRLMALPMKMLEVPAELLPPGTAAAGLPVIMVASQAVAGFSNKGKRYPPNVRPISNELYAKAKKVDLTDFIIQEHNYEPWNEFVLQGTPPVIVKTKTILTRVEWIEGFTDPIGDPALNTNHNTTQAVSLVPAGEAGMT